MDLSVCHLLLAEIRKLSAKMDARWGISKQDAETSQVVSVPTQAAALVADNWGGFFDGGDTFEQHCATPHILADNWEGLFEQPAHILEMREFELSDAPVVTDNWGGQFEACDASAGQVRFDSGLTIPSPEPAEPLDLDFSTGVDFTRLASAGQIRVNERIADLSYDSGLSGTAGKSAFAREGICGSPLGLAAVEHHPERLVRAGLDKRRGQGNTREALPDAAIHQHPPMEKKLHSRGSDALNREPRFRIDTNIVARAEQARRAAIIRMRGPRRRRRPPWLLFRGRRHGLRRRRRPPRLLFRGRKRGMRSGRVFVGFPGEIPLRLDSEISSSDGKDAFTVEPNAGATVVQASFIATGSPHRLAAALNDFVYLDRLSILPDVLLGNIVGRLSIKEAARTAVLARRWRLLWRAARATPSASPLGAHHYFLDVPFEQDDVQDFGAQRGGGEFVVVDENVQQLHNNFAPGNLGLLRRVRPGLVECARSAAPLDDYDVSLDDGPKFNFSLLDAPLNRAVGRVGPALAAAAALRTDAVGAAGGGQLAWVAAAGLAQPNCSTICLIGGCCFDSVPDSTLWEEEELRWSVDNHAIQRLAPVSWTIYLHLILGSRMLFGAVSSKRVLVLGFGILLLALITDQHTLDDGKASDLTDGMPDADGFTWQAGHGRIVTILLCGRPGTQMMPHCCRGYPAAVGGFALLLLVVLEWMARDSFQKLMEGMAEHKADFSAGIAATAWVIAAGKGLTCSIKYLLEAGVDAYIPSEDGTPPVHMAACQGWKECVQVLFHVTAPLAEYATWSIDGILWHVKSSEPQLQLRTDGWGSRRCFHRVLVHSHTIGWPVLLLFQILGKARERCSNGMPIFTAMAGVELNSEAHYMVHEVVFCLEMPAQLQDHGRSLLRLEGKPQFKERGMSGSACHVGPNQADTTGHSSYVRKPGGQSKGGNNYQNEIPFPV